MISKTNNFTGSAGGFRTEKDKIQTDLQKDVEIDEFTILTYGEGEYGRMERSERKPGRRKGRTKQPS